MLCGQRFSQASAQQAAGPCLVLSHLSRRSRYARSITARPWQWTQRHIAQAAPAAAPLQLPETSSASTQEAPAAGGFELSCPICQRSKFHFEAGPGRLQQSYRCDRCQRTFRSREPYLDLTMQAGIEQEAYKQTFWGGTEIFRSPAVSFAYERGWRQNFVWYGFPGADKETEYALDYFRPVWGEPLLDMSCGSGLFSRRFVKSGKFLGVIAADYSDSMLKQTRQFFAEQSDCDPRKFMLLRADVGRLPFATESLSAIHAGAAIHCWPDPSQAMAEISRVLKPGGIFVASTILTASSALGELIGDNNASIFRGLDPMIGPGTSRSYKWWEEAELKELCATMGLTDFRRHRSRRFIMFTVRKPGSV